jgi:hypothetical protein
MSTNKITEKVSECYDLLCAHMFAGFLKKPDAGDGNGETCEPGDASDPG